MIEFMSSWVKGLGLAIVIISILEMLLPNNKTKKYIRMVMGIYLLFTIISPFIANQNIFTGDNFDFKNYTTMETSTMLNQNSMNERIEELYIQELEKDIEKKLEEKGYVVESCKVKAQISDIEEETKITKIKIKIQKSVENETEESKTEQEQDLENKMVTEIQKIKPIDTTIQGKENTENKKEQEEKVEVQKSDIQNIKKFLIEEYGVNEKCLEIN